MIKKILSFFSGGSNTASVAEGKQEGTVKFFNRKKGYGFIRAERTGKDVFVHASSLQANINKGDQVVFELEHSKKGLEAKNVQVI